MRAKICVIDDTDEGKKIVRSAFADADEVEISDSFCADSDITVYFSCRRRVLKNIREGSSVIFSANRPVKTDAAVRPIVCGLYETATVTASSVAYTEDGAEFVYCLQRAVMTLGGEYAEIGEIKVRSEWNCIEKALAAVTARVIVFGSAQDFIELKKEKTYEKKSRWKKGG